jgi:methylmalonyl-CoA/ethylmalonyl-CoA epimerase
MVIDHIGIVVRNLDRGMDVWSRVFGYAQATLPVENVRQSVRVVFLQRAGAPTVKLVEPTEPSSPVSAMARRGGGLHHLCFKTPNMSAALDEVEQAGGRVTVRPQAGEAFMNEPIAFVYIDGLVLEIISSDRRALAL